MRIAYVEDNPTNLALVERIAQMTQHTIDPYSEGEDALQALRQGHYDLILMDVELAGAVDGLEVVRVLRGEGVKTPIIAITAYAMMGDRDRCLAMGCDDYLPKPLPINDFLALLAKYDALLNDQTTDTQPEMPAQQVAAQPEGSDHHTRPHLAPMQPPIPSESRPTTAPGTGVAPRSGPDGRGAARVQPEETRTVIRPQAGDDQIPR